MKNLVRSKLRFYDTSNIKKLRNTLRFFSFFDSTRCIFLLYPTIAFTSLSISFANGFKVQEQSLNATALSSAYVAGARGADASYYNPANMGFTNNWGENKHEFEFAVSLLNIPGFNFNVGTTNQGLSSVTYMDYGGLLGTLKPILQSFGLNIPDYVALEHTPADTSLVSGSTGDTNFVLPKFFYKSKNYNGFNIGASVIAPSGLSMNWNGKGGEFLQDVFIFLLEFSLPISYTYKDIFSIAIGPRVLYGMGKFNNVVYVPLGTPQQQAGNSNISSNNGVLTDNKTGNEGGNCTPSFDPDVAFAGLDGLPSGLVPPEMDSMLAGIAGNSFAYNAIKDILGLPNLGGPGNPDPNNVDAIKLAIIKAMVANIQTCLVGTSQVVQKSDGSAFGFGFRAAASLRVGKNGMFSVKYDSTVPMTFEGSVSAETVIGGSIGSVTMTSPLYLYVNMPEILTVAYSHDFWIDSLRRIRLEATYERTFWSKGNKFDICFQEVDRATAQSGGGICRNPDMSRTSFVASDGSVAGGFTQEQLAGMIALADFSAVAMGSGWVDTDTFRIGLTYIGKRLQLMLSAAYDHAPVPQYAIGIPDSDGYMIGVGAKYNFNNFDIGFAFSNTFKDSARSIYASGGVGQLRIATVSLGYRF